MGDVARYRWDLLGAEAVFWELWRGCRRGLTALAISSPLARFRLEILVFWLSAAASGPVRCTQHHGFRRDRNTMAKRKREVGDGVATAPAVKSRKEQKVASEQAPQRQQRPASKSKEDAPKKTAAVNGKGGEEEAVEDTVLFASKAWAAETATIQIITGSYERVLHGFTAAIPTALVSGDDASGQTDDIPSHDAANRKEDATRIAYSDSFLFNAHASAIRCLALSPYPDNPDGKLFLATGSTDERVNVYSVSLCPVAPSSNKLKLPTLHGTTITENAQNKELGALLHHSSSITAMHFPTRAKLLTAAEDSTIAIVRTRDWVPLSTIKAPVPKAQGRPSGDTAPPGEVPAGINDFAIHPSMKLMLSVGKGEKCMRLWNLVTGKKAGVLSFSREMLAAVGEGRFSNGEGRRVIWDKEGEEFAVAFERGVIIFGIDCKPKAKIIPSPKTKIHQAHYLSPTGTNGENVLSISTEDGRVMFYNTSLTTEPEKREDIAPCSLIAQLGGPGAGITGRVKDYEILPIPAKAPSTMVDRFLITTGGSDGTVRLWLLLSSDLRTNIESEKAEEQSNFTTKQVGKIVGTYSTNTRITCLKAFVMTGQPVKGDERHEEDREKRIVESSSDEEED
jgi:protein MAK11